MGRPGLNAASQAVMAADEYDIIIFSDTEAKNFQLHPQFFDHNLFGTKILTFPDRVRLTVEAVQAGTHMMFLGGWLSFNGEMGKGGWGRSLFRDLFPIKGCQGPVLFPQCLSR